jgi:hypothetical protein
MRSSRFAVAYLATALALVGVAGCGSSEESPTTGRTVTI